MMSGTGLIVYMERSIEQIEKELKAVTWHIDILIILQDIYRKQYIENIDKEIARIDKILRGIDNENI